MRQGRKRVHHKEYKGNKNWKGREGGTKIIEQASAVGNRKCVNIRQSDKQTEREWRGQNLKLYGYVCVREAMCLYLNLWREIVTGDENATLSEILQIQSQQDWAPESTVC